MSEDKDANMEGTKCRSFDGGPVGYKHPPAEHQFKKGQKPPGSGRKKGSKNLTTIAHETMDTKVTAMVDGKRRRVAAKEALFLRATALGLTGNVRDIERVLNLYERYCREQIEAPPIRFQLIPGDDW